MSAVQSPSRLFDELAELFASSPDREAILSFHPSKEVQYRAHELLEKLRQDRLSTEEQRELDQFEQAEMLMRLVKARLLIQSGRFTV